MDKMIILDIQDIILQKIKKLDIEIESLKNDKVYISNIKDFLKKYENNIFDEELLLPIFQKFNMNKPLEFFIKANDTLKYLREKDSDIFKFQINKCQEIIDQLINKIEITYNSLLTKEGSINYLIKENRKHLEILYKISDSITEDGFVNYFDEPMSNVLFDLIDSSNLSVEEKCDIIFLFTQENSKKIEENINILINNRKIEQKKQRKNKKEEFVKIVKNDDDFDKSSNLTGVHKDLYDTVKKIINQNNYEIKSEMVELVLSKIDLNTSIEERLVLYNSINDVNIKLQIIIEDLKRILSNIDNNIELLKSFNLIKEIIEFYKTILKQSSNDKTFIDLLKQNNYQSELDICLNIQKLLLDLNDILITNYNGNIEEEKYQILFSSFQKLKDEYENYGASVELYFEDFDESAKEFMNSYYSKMKQTYDVTTYQYFNIEAKNDSILMEKANDFYNVPNMKNIYLFLGDDGNVSNIERDILQDESLKTSDYGSVIQKLKDRLSDDFVANGDHKAKSDNYTEKFLTTYRVKSIKDNQSRIFYSRFSTKLSDNFERIPKDVHIVFLYQVGYGNTGENKKANLYENALRICFDNREYIDYVVNLFNTSLQDIPEEEKIKKEQEIANIINQNKLKLGHLINSYDLSIKKGGVQNGQK